MSVENPITARERRLIDSASPALTSLPFGAGLYAIFQRLVDSINVALGLQNVSEGARPFLNPSNLHDPGGLASKVYLGDWSTNGGGVGDDDSGDGTLTSPFNTIPRAVQVVGILNRTTVDFLFAPGSFASPGVLSLFNYIDWMGFESDTVAQGAPLWVIDSSGVIEASVEKLVLDLTETSTGTVIADALVGTRITYADGPASGKRGWVSANDASGGGKTRVTVTQNATTGTTAPVDGNTLQTATLDTEITFADATGITACLQFNIRSCHLTGSKPLSAFGTSKADVNGCMVELLYLRAGEGGGLYQTDTFNGCIGNGTHGMFSVVAGGLGQISNGSVIHASFASPTPADSKQFINCDAAGKFFYRSMVHIRALGTKGIVADGSDWIARGGISSEDNWHFIDCDEAWNINSTGEGTGGDYQLPNASGTLNDGGAGHAGVPSGFTVRAQNCACVSLGPDAFTLTANDVGSTVARVSADGGSTASATAAPDTVVIFNGTPAP